MKNLINVTDLISGFSSDHIIQEIKLELYQDNELMFTIQGASWNMMNQCHSRMGHSSYKHNPEFAYSNNPFDIDEDKEQFISRKKLQWLEIEKLIESNKQFIFLQEIDCLLREPVKSYYIKKLADKNWHYIITPGIGYQPLAILYDSAKLSPNDNGNGEFGIGGKFRGFGSVFKYNNADLITLINVHLDYNIDYSEYLMNFQQQQIEKNIVTIIGGDMNYPYGLDICAWPYATNIACNDDGQIVDVHEDTNIKKKYDGFLVSPNLLGYLKVSYNQDYYYHIEFDQLLFKPLANNFKILEFTTLTGRDWLNSKLNWQELNFAKI